MHEILRIMSRIGCGSRIGVGRSSLVRFLIVTTILITATAPSMGKPPQPGPAVLIIAPKSGLRISAGEKIEIQVLVRSDIRASAVQISCDGRGIGLLNKAPFAATWDTSNLKDGTYIIQASAYLDSGKALSAVPVEIFVEAAPVAAPAQSAMLLNGTPVLLATEAFLKSGETKTGTTILFKVERDVLAPDGRILIPYGAMAAGEVLESRNHGLFGRAGKLNFEVRSVTAADGTEVPLRAVRNESADGRTGRVVVGALLLSPLILLFNGPNVEIPAGTVITAYVDTNTPIARTLPSRLDPALTSEIRSAVITSPGAQQIVKKEKVVTLECAITPADENAYIRMYIDGEMILNEKAVGGKLEWKGSKAFEDGAHTLEAEVTFSTGHIVKSPPVEFILGRAKK